MIDYFSDIKEIIAFINCAPYSNTNDANYKECLRLFTETTGEEFLDKRAEYISDSIANSKDLLSAFSKLSLFCDKNKPHGCESCVVKKYCNSYINRVQGHILKLKK